MEWKYITPFIGPTFKYLKECFVRPKKHCLIIVEDNALDSKLLLLHLRNSNCNIDIADTAEEALGMMRTKEYSVAFIDLRLPCMQGWKLAEEILDEFPKTHIVISCAETFDLSHIPKGVYVGLIIKPATAHALNSLLEKTRLL